MGIEISAPVAGVGGGVMLAGGGALAYVGRQQVAASTSLAQFATPTQLLPTLKEFQGTLGYTDQLLQGVQGAMRTARLPGEGILRRVPFLGGAADDLERAVRIGAAAQELSKVDETALIASARELNASTSRLVTAAEDDIVRFGAAKAGAMSGGTKLLIGGGVAAVGALLLATAIFDVE